MNNKHFTHNIMSKKTNKLFMAFATGSESTEGAIVRRYIGVAPVFIKMVNPTKAEMEAFYNTTLDKEPEYVGTSEVGPEGNKRTVQQVRLTFMAQTVADKCNGIDMKTPISFYVRNEFRYNNERTKVQIVNPYGEFTWVPVNLPDGSQNNKLEGAPEWFTNVNSRPAYVGEEEVTGFIKAYLNIPGLSYRKKDGTVVRIDDPKNAEARLENIADYFKGNFAELKRVIAYQANNKVKALFGVKTTNDNKQYQDVYIQKFLKNAVTDVSGLEKDMKDRKAAGSYPNTEFEICDLRVYEVGATSFAAPQSAAAPAPANFGGFFAPPAGN